MIETPPHEQIAAFRASLGYSLAIFGAAIGCSSKGRMSEIENGKIFATPEQAIAIERLSAGRIDAAQLNAVVAAAREGIQRGAVQCWHLTEAEMAALPVGPDGGAAPAADSRSHDSTSAIDDCPNPQQAQDLAALADG